MTSSKVNQLGSRIKRFICSGDGNFGELALALFSCQFDRNVPYQVFCQAQGMIPGNVKTWQEIPAIPIQAFKTAVLSTSPGSPHAAVFHSSATTSQIPGRHYLATLDYYHASLESSFTKWVLPDGLSMPFVMLVPSPQEAPHSSLTDMLETVFRKLGRGGGYFIKRGAIDEPAVDRTLAYAENKSSPVALLGTTIGFLSFFDCCEKSGKTYRLPEGSRIMDTGGMKTEKRVVDRREFLRLCRRFLDVPENRCINEYSMCELSSQFYAVGSDPVLQVPPWVRVEIVEGLIRIYDLANVDSVMAVQTEDVGEYCGGGFILKGRASGAERKGCSLALENYLSEQDTLFGHSNS
jgi:hypothetical protein